MSGWDTAAARAAANLTQTVVDSAKTIRIPVGGQFRLDPGSVRGWGTVGPIDDTNTQNLGTHTATNLNRTAGGQAFSTPMNMVRFHCWHRNSDALAEAFGWVIFHQQKTDGANSRSTTFVLHETQANGDVGPRNYLNNVTQLTDIDLSGISAGQNIPVGNIIGLGVAAPTAIAAPNQEFVQCFGGYLELEVV